jgi:hypothetical protein
MKDMRAQLNSDANDNPELATLMAGARAPHQRSRGLCSAAARRAHARSRAHARLCARPALTRAVGALYLRQACAART